MDSENDVTDNETNVVAESSASRSIAGKKNQGKVPKKIHKAHREKLKREHLNELFLKLADALELNEQNNGKASILNESIRLLKGTLVQVETLRRENKTLLSESQYVTLEKNELEDENSMLASQIEKLLGEIKAKELQSKPDLNASPPEFQQPEQVSHLSEGHYRFSDGDPALPQTAFMGPVLLLPLGSDLQAYVGPDQALSMSSKPASIVSKPCPRYPDPKGSWPSQLLEEQLKASTAGRSL